MRNLSYVVLAILFTAAGCTDATSPGSVNKYAALSTEQAVFLGLPGETLQTPLAVKVYDYRNGQGIPNVSVRFTTTNGPRLDYTATTGTDGVAELTAFKLNPAPLKYSVTATVDGVGSISFTTIAVSSILLQKYEIVSSGGVPVPADSAHSIYELFDDGTYASGYDRSGTITLGPRARYVAGDGSVTFCREPRSVAHTPLVGDCGYSLATGTIIGNTMNVAYADDPYLDLEGLTLPNEVYIRQN